MAAKSEERWLEWKREKEEQWGSKPSCIKWSEPESEGGPDKGEHWGERCFSLNICM